ncbi:unnamed protein product, partial [Musa acuminata subsp. burmannicoides]
MISCPDHLLQLRSIKNPRGRATSTISTSTTIWLSCLLALWGPDQTLLIHIKVVTFIILSRRVLTSQAANELFANYVIKLDTPRKSVGLVPDSLLHHSGLRRISWLLQLLLNLIGLWIRAPLITSPLIFKTCPSTTTMTEMKISSSVTDLSTGASLVQGQNKDNIYEWPSTSQITLPTAHSSIAAPVDVWHRRLGHPSPFIQQKL